MDWYDPRSDDWYEPNDYSLSAFFTSSEPATIPKLPHNRRIRRIAFILCMCIVAGTVIWAVTDAILGKHESGFNDDGMPVSFVDYIDAYYSVTEGDAYSTEMPRLEDISGLRIYYEENSGSELDFSEIYSRCVGSVVGIRVYYKDDTENYGWGTGMIATEDGFIVTNGHIVDECINAEVLLYDGSSARAKLVALDQKNDIAIIKIARSGLPHVTFAPSSALEVGEPVCAIGNPLGPDYSLSMTSGIISGTERTVTMRGLSMDLIQTDAVINNGNSGGPLINRYGNVVGITNMKFVSSLTRSVEGMTFAVPSDKVLELIEAATGNYSTPGVATIGVTVGPVPEEAAEYYDIPQGLYVCSVAEGTGAVGKLQHGDIIVKVNGKAVSKNDELTSVKDSLDIGDTIHFSVWRDGKTLELDVVLADSHDVVRVK